jgi:hypothetical protein
MRGVPIDVDLGPSARRRRRRSGFAMTLPAAKL